MNRHSKGVQVAILVGGLGTRLRDVAPNCAKPLVDVGGRPFIHWKIEWLRDQGYSDIVLCVGHRAEDFYAVLGDGSRFGVRIEYSREESPLGTAGALRLALPLFRTSYFVVQNGDTHCDVDLRTLVGAHLHSGARATIAVTKVNEVSQFGKVEVCPNMSIIRFCEKSESAGSGFVNAGTYVMDCDLIRRLTPGMRFSLETDVFPKMCGPEFRAFCANGMFSDIGTPESLNRAREYFGRCADRLCPRSW